MAVASYDEIEKVQDVGNSNRTVGATLMNATSSRAHTIVTISLTQQIKGQIAFTPNSGAPSLI